MIALIGKANGRSVLSSSYCGIAGKIQVGRTPVGDLEWLLTYAWFGDQTRPSDQGDGYLIQRLGPRAGLTLPVPRKVKQGTTLSGVLWTASGLEHSREGHLCLEQHRLQQLIRGDMSVVSELQGDYVCAVAHSSGVTLVRSPDSNRNLYYRIADTRQGIAWSTNYVELASDRLGDIDTSRLAAFAWGADTMIYPGVERLEQGEVVQVKAQHSGLELAKYNTPPLAPSTDELVPPRSLKSYTHWAEKNRKLLQVS